MVACGQTWRMWILSMISIGMFSFIACENDNAKADGTPGPGDTDSDMDTDTDSDTDTDTDTDADTETDSDSGTSEESICGDGELAEDEACDDGNTDDNDGCSGDCMDVAEGFSCIPPGKECHPIAACGDGRLQPPELCDDGNLNEADGCSDLCQVEIGYKCEGPSELPSECMPTICGDGIKEGAESCDDGNDVPFDGCSMSCQREPDCAAGACVSECGDGLVLGETEECDDGNNVPGDGCSEVCQVEDGYRCSQDRCEDEETCRIRVPVLFRDFNSSHPDFQVGCGEQMDGMVEPELGLDGRPVATPLAVKGCITQFDDWYTNDPDRLGSEIPYKVDEIVLFPNGDGGFVNRYGADGEQWLGYELDGNGNGVWVEPIADDVADCMDAGCVECATQEGRGMGCPAPTVQYDGNPLFLPVDDLAADMTYAATVPAQYGWFNWPKEEWLTGVVAEHNFSFTSEVTYWFKYEADTMALLDFSGDDDVWVFVNGQLALDLGAPHMPLNGVVEISADNSYGMTDGNVYKINIFHAERKSTGSSFKLTLGGFNTARSECRPECGDGVVGVGEECDDGENPGGYGQCNDKCRFDGYCGDGIIQEEYENCDDGNYRNGDDCPSSCRIFEVE